MTFQTCCLKKSTGLASNVTQWKNTTMPEATGSISFREKYTNKIPTVLVRVLLLLTDTMTKATLIRTTFNWAGL
jgi:ABC-type antimicrobial peptide transport system permease subunit